MDFVVFAVDHIAPDRYVQAEQEAVVTMTKCLRKSVRAERFPLVCAFRAISP